MIIYTHIYTHICIYIYTFHFILFSICCFPSPFVYTRERFQAAMFLNPSFSTVWDAVADTFKIAETKTKILHAFILLFPCRNIWNVCQALYEATDKGRKQWAPQSLHTGVCLFIEFIKCLISLEKLFKESGMINSHYSNKCPLDTR